MRTIASQMKDAEGQIDHRQDQRHARGRRAAARFVASGRTITFYGFLKAYVEAVDESLTGSPTTRRPGCRS